MWRPRILLADDHVLLLDAFTKLLETEYEIAGVFADGRTLLDEAPKLKPHVIILDISMPLMNGLEAARQLKRKLPDVKLIFVTVNHDPDLAAEAFRIGGSAYLLKSAAASELFRAIEDVLAGRSYISPAMTQGMIESLAHPTRTHTRAGCLTSRQSEVLQLLAEGHSMKQTAAILGITPRTVAYHKYVMMEQLGIKSTAELVQFAVKHGIISG
ncbi:MAG TPA: response regulator transcription factor [Candidatus Hydrogenedentes bacterium]|nr:response regulator transcription factor [Candidatus Hydrogenedentota bacterium]